MWKALSVIAAIFVAGAAFLSFLNKQDAEKERELLATSKSNLDSMTQQLAEATEEKKLFVDRKIPKMTTRRDEAEVRKEEEKQNLQDKKDEVEAVKAEITALEAEIANAKARIAEIGTIEELLKVIEGLRTDLFTAKSQIATLEGGLASSTKREEQTSTRIQNLKDLEYRQRNGEMVSINAPISAVYNSWGFVVLGAGDRQGVVTRTKLDVKRGGEKIAELMVTNLESNRAVCDIVPGSLEPGQMIRPGDKVSVNPDSLPKPKAAADADAGGAGGAGAADPAAPGGAKPAMPADPFAPTPTPADPDDPFADLGGGTPETPTTPTTPEDPATPGAEDDPFKGL